MREATSRRVSAREAVPHEWREPVGDGVRVQRHSRVEAGSGRSAGGRYLPAGRDQPGDLLQLEEEI